MIQGYYPVVVVLVGGTGWDKRGGTRRCSQESVAAGYEAGFGPIIEVCGRPQQAPGRARSGVSKHIRRHRMNLNLPKSGTTAGPAGL